MSISIGRPTTQKKSTKNNCIQDGNRLVCHVVLRNNRALLFWRGPWTLCNCGKPAAPFNAPLIFDSGSSKLSWLRPKLDLVSTGCSGGTHNSSINEYTVWIVSRNEIWGYPFPNKITRPYAPWLFLVGIFKEYRLHRSSTTTTEQLKKETINNTLTEIYWRVFQHLRAALEECHEKDGGHLNNTIFKKWNPHLCTTL